MKDLRFRADGTLTVVQFTDVHWTTGEGEDLLTKQLIEYVLEAEKPDFVMFTGDLISGNVIGKDEHGDPIRAICQVVEPVNDRSIPWSAVFGNHDGQGQADNRELLEALKRHQWCLMESGPEQVTGVGNYVLRIKSAHDDQVKALFYCFDSGDRSPLGGWDAIKRDQIAWYADQSASFIEQHGMPLPALAFFHIPLPEYDEVWDHHVSYGYKYEKVCCPNYNTGLFAAMLEMGDVMGTFVGHDHTNDYCGDLLGIRLCYGRSTGGYGKEFVKGARVIKLKEGVRGFDSWIRLADHTAIYSQPEHQPEGRVIMNK